MSEKISVFEVSSYIDFLKKMIALNKDVYGYKAKLAAAAGCQRSFFSQVLAGQTDLAVEHAIGLADYWGLNDQEKDYFFNLVLHKRAATKNLRDYFAQKIESTKKDQEVFGRRIVDKVVVPDIQAATFYSAWQYLAITILLTIKKFRTVTEISHRLNIATDVVERSLQELAQLGMVKKSGHEWEVVNGTIHLSNDSKFNSLNHSHWRNRAVQDSLLTENKSLHYTSVCSVSLEDAEKLRQLMFRFVDDSRRIVAPSREEELFCLTCDWFKV